jgi:hypothetical protein
MKSEKSKIENLEKELSRLKMGFNQMMEAVKEESINSRAANPFEIARRLMCFYFGQHINSINIGDKFAKTYTIREGSKWVESAKTFVNDGSTYIYDNMERVGFICKHIDMINTFTEDELTDIWIWYCKKRHFRGSFIEFTNCCKGVGNAPVLLDIFTVYNEYLDDDSSIIDFALEVIDEPTIKVEGMVICIINR